MSTVTHVDPIHVPKSVQISSILTQTAARMFDGLFTTREPLAVTDEIFDAWKLIREMAHLYANHGAQLLDSPLEWKLVDALVLAHKLHHRGDSLIEVLPPGACDCQMAERLRDLAPLILKSFWEEQCRR